MSLKNIKVILSTIDNKIIEELISSEIKIDYFQLDKISDIFINKGESDFMRYCKWNLKDYQISVFGWKKGNEKNINKTEIPPPEDIDLYYGDILFVKTDNKNNLIDFTKNDYNEFYNLAYGGFESLGSSDSDSDSDIDDYDSDDSFIDNGGVDIIKKDSEYIRDSSESDDDIEDEMFTDDYSDNSIDKISTNSTDSK